MKKAKITALILAMAIITCVFSACTPTDKTVDGSSSADTTTAATSADTTTAATSADTTTAATSADTTSADTTTAATSADTTTAATSTATTAATTKATTAATTAATTKATTAAPTSSDGFRVLSFTKYTGHYGFFIVFSEAIQDLGADNEKIANDFIVQHNLGATLQPGVGYAFRKLEAGNRVLSLTTIASQACSAEFTISMKPKEEIQYIKNAAGQAPETFTGEVVVEQEPAKAAEMLAAVGGGSGSVSAPATTKATVAATTRANNPTAPTSSDGFYVMSFTKYTGHYGFFIVFSEPIQDLGANNEKIANDFIVQHNLGATLQPGVGYAFRKLEAGNRVLSLTTIASQACSAEFNISMKPKEEIQYIKNAAGEAPETFTGEVVVEQEPAKAAEMLAAVGGGSVSVPATTKSTTAATTRASGGAAQTSSDGFYVMSFTKYTGHYGFFIVFSEPIQDLGANNQQIANDFVVQHSLGGVLQPGVGYEFRKLEGGGRVLSLTTKPSQACSAEFNISMKPKEEIQYIKNAAGEAPETFTGEVVVEQEPAKAADMLAAVDG